MVNAKFNVTQANMLNAIKPSGIRKMFARAQGLEGVISLGIGAPDLLPPKKLLEEINNVMYEKRVHGYQLNSGIPTLREKISAQYKNEYNLDYTPEGVVVGSGGTQLLYGAIFAYTNPGDEVIVPDPGFVYYPTIPLMAGCKVIPIPLDENFQMPTELIKEAVTENTRLIIANTPGNPTGAVLEEDCIKGISDIAIDNDIVILSDEVYEFIIFDGIKHLPISKFAPDNTVILNSFSKTYCIPGWRLGYAIASDHLIGPLAKIHPFMIANAPSMPQYAIANIMGTDSDLQFRMHLRETMQERRDVVTEEFDKIPGVTVPKITGSFYAFPKIESDRYRSSNPGEEFVEDIFKNAKVVMVPGSEFGTSGNKHFRISFGSGSVELLRESAERIINYLEQD